MANQFGKVSVGITASTGGLTAGLQSASKQLRGFGKHVQAIRGRMSTLVAIQGGQMFGSIASQALQAGRALVGMGQDAASTIDRTAKLSRQLGMTYAELSGLSLAATLSGTTLDAVAQAALKADKRFVEAANGSESARKAFELAGVSLQDLQGLSSAERFRFLADAIGDLPTSAQRATAAMTLFEESGANLLNMFEGGGDVIRQSMLDAQRFGTALSGVQANNVEAMNDAFTRSSAAIGGIVTQITANLSTAITSVANQFTEMVGTVGGANIGKAIADGLLDGAIYMAKVADYIIAGVGPSLNAVFQNLSGAVSGLFRVAEFFRGIFNGVEIVFGVVIRGLGEIVEQLAKVARSIGRFLGFDVSSLNDFISGAEAFNDAIGAGIMENVGEMSNAFHNAFKDDIFDLGADYATPLTDALLQARKDMQDGVADALPSKIEAMVKANVSVNTADLKAMVVGTREAESYRNALLRGQDPRGNVDGQIAGNTKRAADGIDALPARIAAAMQPMAVASI